MDTGGRYRRGTPSPDAADLPAVATGRRFAVFAAVLFIAHLVLPWFALRGHEGELRPQFWWRLLSDHTLPESATFQVLWMAASLGLLLWATGAGRRRIRSVLLIIIGAGGLLIPGYGAFVRWAAPGGMGLGDPAQILVLLTAGALLSAGLQSAELGAMAVLPPGQRRRWPAAVLGLVTLVLLLSAGAAGLAVWAGGAESLRWLELSDLLPGRSVRDYMVLGANMLPAAGLMLAASALTALLPLLPSRATVRLMRAGHWTLRLAVLSAPVITAAFTRFSPLRRGEQIVPAEFFEARTVVIYALYWFCLAVGGEVLLTSGLDSDDEERF